VGRHSPRHDATSGDPVRAPLLLGSVGWASAAHPGHSNCHDGQVQLLDWHWCSDLQHRAVGRSRCAAIGTLCVGFGDQAGHRSDDTSARRGWTAQARRASPSAHRPNTRLTWSRINGHSLRQGGRADHGGASGDDEQRSARLRYRQALPDPANRYLPRRGLRQAVAGIPASVAHQPELGRHRQARVHTGREG